MNSQPYEQALYTGMYKQVRGTAQALTPDTLDDLMSKIFDVITHTVDALSQQDPPAIPIACKAGCGHCCSVQVQVLPVEVLHLVSYLRRTRTADQLQTLTEQVSALDERVHGLLPAERILLGLPCALLVDDRCSAYEARPVICRSANSSDVGRCRAAIGPNATGVTVPTYEHQVAVCRQVTLALATGLQQTGFATEPLEFMSALRIALEHSDPFKAWKEGQLIFADAAAPGRTEA
jgi:uncharacterized protein